MESISAERWGGSELNVRHQSTSATEKAPVFRSRASRSREGIILLYSALVALLGKYCIQSWAPQPEKLTDKLEQVQRRAGQGMGAHSVRR